MQRMMQLLVRCLPKMRCYNAINAYAHVHVLFRTAHSDCNHLHDNRLRIISVYQAIFLGSISVSVRYICCRGLGE